MIRSMTTTTVPVPTGSLRTFLSSGALASALVFGNLAVEAAEEEADKKEAAWIEDVTKAKAPDTPAKGKIKGTDFTVEKATLQGGGILVLRQGKEFFADLELMIFTFEHDEEKLPGKTFKFDAAPVGASPHIHMKWRENGKNIPSSKVFMSKYSLTLEFGKPTKKGLPGTIYLCLPDEEKSFVAGTFVATSK